MKGFLVDTNIFLRLLTEDDATQTPPAKNFLARVVAGKTQAYVTVPVILELVWTLESYFKVARADLAKKLSLLVNTPNLGIENREVIEESVDYYKDSKADFVDCYNAAFAKLNSDGTVMSFDRHFDKLEGVKRTEP